MTAFSTGDLPTSITTVEQLLVWASTVLNDLYPSTTVVEAVGQSQRVIESGPFYITASDPNTWRLITRSSIALAPQWRRTAKLWQHAQEIGTTAIPSEYKS